MRNHLDSLRGVLATTVFFAGSCMALSTPIIAVGNAQPTTWQQGINNGNVGPTTGPMTGPAMRFYAQVVTARGLAGYQQVVPVTRAITIGRGRNARSVLNTTWQPVNTPLVMSIAGASYLYRTDPNLTNFVIDADTFSPMGIQDAGIELIDTNGLAAGWFTTTPEIDRRDDYDLVLDDQAPQGQFSYFSEDPGFSLTDVMEVRFEQSSIYGLPFQEPDPAGGIADWDGYSDWEAVPEPGVLPALGVGLLGLFAAKRRIVR